MIGRLLKRLFGSKQTGRAAPPARPVSPPAPSVSPAQAAPMPPPPPPPPTKPVVPVAQAVSTPQELPDVEVPAEGGRVKMILDDGTLVTPALDDELAERLRYIVDNIVTPPEQPST